MAEADEELLAIEDDTTTAPADLSLLPADSELAVCARMLSIHHHQDHQEMEATSEPAVMLTVEDAEDTIEAEERRLLVSC